MAENNGKTAKRRGPGRPFRAGQSGNPGGRPKEDVHVRELARQRTEAAIQTLEHIMLSGEMESARVRAAEALLSRGWGQPGQSIDIAPERAPLNIVVSYVDSSGPADSAK